ncbi:MAG: DUF748 domain-containing protein [Candidatus Omnitrophica bacterium]|nr:DUF748 domain-containing protein [Candidatus Omnitrophota bacterium]
MRKIIKLFLILILLLIIVFISACIFVGLKGKDIATAKLEEILNTNVEIGSVNVSFPLDLKINSLDIENLLKVDEIHISFGVIDLLKRNIELPGLRLLRPQLIVRRTEAGINLLGANLKNHSFCEYANSQFLGENLVFAATEKITTNTQEAVPLNIMIHKLIVKDGKIKFIDKTLSPKVFQADIVNINIKAYKISFPPRPFDMIFDIAADILTAQGEPSYSTISADGWINLIDKDMKADIAATNLDGTYFYPYYKKFLSRKLKSADVNFKSNLTAKNNDLTADCNLEIKDLLFDEPQIEELKDIKILDIIGGGIAQKSRDINLNFRIRTKLDNPKINSAQIRGAVLDKVLEGVVSQPTEETMKDIKDIGEGIKEIGKELEEKFKSIFKRE